jgi:AcrR family transcriptional regulator
MAALRTNNIARSTAATSNLLGQRLGRKGQETRDRIICAMSDLLQDPDETPITLGAIARAAGTGMSTLYLYFPDIGALVLAVLDRTVKMHEAGFDSDLGEWWPDEVLADRVLTFARAHFSFWQKYARLLQMRNSFADAGDLRFVSYRQEMAQPILVQLVRQMGAEPGGGDPLFDDCAAVMLTGLERMATVLIHPDFAMLTGVEGAEERNRLVERLARAEALVIEMAMRALRARCGGPARPGMSPAALAPAGSGVRSGRS